MLIKNTNPRFGHPGPFQVESVGQLCQEMMPCFDLYTDEVWERHLEDSEMCGWLPQDEAEFRKEVREDMLEHFKKCLEVVQE